MILETSPMVRFQLYFLQFIERLFHEPEVSLHELGAGDLPVPVHVQAVEDLLGPHPGAQSGQHLPRLLGTKLVRYFLGTLSTNI